MSEFSDRPFVAGSLIGRRAFSVDPLGRLIGPAFGGIFKPGENEAKHGIPMDPFFGVPIGRSGRPSHRAGGMDCSCGYYAYFDDSTTYESPGRVTALIEGYGLCTVGARGFRAEKARLVALVDPSRPLRGASHPQWYDRLADWSRRHDDLSAALVVICVLSVALAPLGILLGKAHFHSIARKYPSVSDVSRCADHGQKIDRLDFDRIRENYPDVPVYPTIEDALKEHPVTVPEQPTPSNTADFWEISA